MDITSISNNVLGEASQAMDSGVYLVQCVRCPTVPNSGAMWSTHSQLININLMWFWPCIFV